MPYVDNSEIHGHGVFADKDYSAGDTIEVCPYLVTDDEDMGKNSVLHDYMFESPNHDSKEYLIPLGYAMVYNHRESPNAEWEIKETDYRFVRFFALDKVKQGEEIFHDYGIGYWKDR